jgi:hypothetical protein
VVLATLLLAAACGGGSPDAVQEPDMDALVLRRGYEQAVEHMGSDCELLDDTGYRELLWTYDDGTVIRAGIFNGRLSGLEVGYPEGFRGRRGEADERVARGVRADLPERALRQILGDDPLLLEDTSGRRCRWTLPEGELEARFVRGELREATWQEPGAEPSVLVEISDWVGFLLEDLEDERDFVRTQALMALQEQPKEPRMAEPLLAMLEREEDASLRGRAALLLADLEEGRASDLLLRDLQRARVPDDILEALGRIGDLRAADALLAAMERTDSSYRRRRLGRARSSILDRYRLSS